MSRQTTHTDDLYLNDFHRQWDEECEKSNAIMRSTGFSHAFAKAQSERLEAAWRERERAERLRRKRKSSSKDGQ